MHLLYISIVQLSKYKIFIGHSILNSILLSSWLIFNLRGKVTILNLFHTIKMLKLSYALIKQVSSLGLPIWFINFDLTKENIVTENALNSGEFYLTRQWIRGLVSNYFVITKAYRQYLVKKEFIEVRRVKEIYDKWLLTRFTWPRAIFISNIKTSYIIAKEAASVKVPTIALVDSNVKTFPYNLPVGSNDDSLDAIAYMNSIISNYIIKCKYKKVLIWYYFNRNVNRFKTLSNWLNKLIDLKKKIIYRINLKNIVIPNYFNHYIETKKGLNFFFGRSFNYRLLRKHKINEVIKYNSFDLFYYKNKISLYNRFKAFKYFSLSYKYRIKFKRFYYTKKIEGITLFKSFLNNFIRLKGIPKRFKRIKVKKRIRMERKKISKSFKSFYSFIFFFYSNKFNIIIDYYKKKVGNLHSLIKINNISKKQIKMYGKDFKIEKVKKYKVSYMYRFKSKKIYKWKKRRKYNYIYKPFKDVKKEKMNFFFFYWKYFIIFFGLKLRSKFLNRNNIYRNKLFITEKKEEKV